MSVYLRFPSYNVGKGQPFFYFSFPSQDVSVAGPFARDLFTNGINIYYFQGFMLYPTWEQEIDYVIKHRNCAGLILTVSSYTLNSPGVLAETATAYSCGKPILSVFIEKIKTNREPMKTYLAGSTSVRAWDMPDAEAKKAVLSCARSLLDGRSPTLTQKSAAPFSKKAVRLFISYSTKDKAYVEKIRGALEKSGIDCWIAPDSIPAGRDYADIIEQAVNDCDAFLLVLSENSQNSTWVPKELDLALSAGKTIFPLQIDNAEVKSGMRFRLINCQITAGSKDLPAAVDRITKSLKSL